MKAIVQHHVPCDLVFSICLAFLCLHSSLRTVAAPIHRMAESGNQQEIRLLVAKAPDQVNVLDDLGWTPLMYAVRDKHIDVIKTLLEKDARLSIRDKMGHNVLDQIRLYLVLSSDEHLDDQIGLWKRQKNVSQDQIAERITAYKDKYGEESRKKWLEIQPLLVNALQKEKAADRESPLLAAVVQGNAEETKRLLKMGANTEVKDSSGRTPLLLAVRQGNMDIVKLLLDHGAKTGEPDKDGQTAFSTARQMFELFVTARRERDVRYLQELHAKGKLDVDSKDKHGETALMRAVAEGRLEDVKCLLQIGARTDIRNNKGESLKDVICTRTPPIRLKEEILKCIGGVKNREPSPTTPNH